MPLSMITWTTLSPHWMDLLELEFWKADIPGGITNPFFSAWSIEEEFFWYRVRFLLSLLFLTFFLPYVQYWEQRFLAPSTWLHSRNSQQVHWALGGSMG